MAPSAQTPTRPAATLDDFLAIPECARFHEILDGELVRKATPSARHGLAQAELGALLAPYDNASRHPGGWWLTHTVEILLPARQPVSPDLAAWRVDRMPELTDECPVKLLPDWVCEVVSPNDSRRDTVIKYRDYARAGIPYYWLVDLSQKTVTTLRLTDGHYVVAAEARAGEQLRAEPFELVEIEIGVLFGERRRSP